MLVFDKNEIKKQITIEDIYDFLEEWGGEPFYTDFGLISATICHNESGGSKKLYYYEENQMFYCYTNCGSFDIFDLVIKVYEKQQNKVLDLNDAIRLIAARAGIAGRIDDVVSEDKLIDWDILSNYDRIQKIQTNIGEKVQLKEYDNDILDRFNYSLKISPWLEEDITQEVIDFARIGYYPGGDQITIPHYDENNRFIGLRGRTLCEADAELYGKYRPLRVNNMTYNHPLGMNLYGLNWAKSTIKPIKKAIVLESEKSVLKYMSYFGIENNIAVACCGSSFTFQHFIALLNTGAEEIIIAFDKQYEALNTEESKKWKEKLMKIYRKYKNECLISFMWDKEDLLNYKSSPIDEGKDKFLYLFKERIIL